MAHVTDDSDELAFTGLSDNGKRPGTDIEIGALIGAAIDQAVADGAVSKNWTGLVTHAGFRTAIGDGVLELRAAGLGIAEIQRAEPGPRSGS